MSDDHDPDAIRTAAPATSAPPRAERISHERLALASLERALVGIDGITIFRGQGGGNRFGVADWELTLGQQFQFGDLRVEMPSTTVVVEVESGGGVGNLVKYWPLLASGALEKQLVLLHVFRITSAGDYIAHRRLWEFLVERMREDLRSRGVLDPDAWEARVFTYRAGEEATDAAEALRAIVVSAVERRGDNPNPHGPQQHLTERDFSELAGKLEQLRGTSRSGLSTDEILAPTRGERRR